MKRAGRGEKQGGGGEGKGGTGAIQCAGVAGRLWVPGREGGGGARRRIIRGR